ncbi:unnamed protein product, partial [Ixodes hexagonus]
SPYRSHLSAAILRLQENGTMQMFKNRWWKVGPGKQCPGDTRSDVSRSGSASELGLAKVGGVFVVLLAGLGVACVIAFVEFFCKTRSSIKGKHRPKLPSVSRNGAIVVSSSFEMAVESHDDTVVSANLVVFVG